MEWNAENVLDALNDFERKPDISPVLNEYLKRIAKNGEIVFPWNKLKPLLKKKLDIVLDEFYETCPVETSVPVPNFEAFNFETLKKTILSAVESFTSAPFTIQRLCELVTDPQKHYNRTDKYMRGIEKNVLVVSTVEPRLGVPGEANNINNNPVVNGMPNDSQKDDNDTLNGHENSVSSSNLNTPSNHVLLENFANVFPSAACIPSSTNMCITRENDDEIIREIEEKMNREIEEKMSREIMDTVDCEINPESIMETVGCGINSDMNLEITPELKEEISAELSRMRSELKEQISTELNQDLNEQLKEEINTDRASDSTGIKQESVSKDNQDHDGLAQVQITKEGEVQVSKDEDFYNESKADRNLSVNSESSPKEESEQNSSGNPTVESETEDMDTSEDDQSSSSENPNNSTPRPVTCDVMSVTDLVKHSVDEQSSDDSGVTKEDISDDEGTNDNDAEISNPGPSTDSEAQQKNTVSQSDGSHLSSEIPSDDSLDEQPFKAGETTQSEFVVSQSHDHDNHPESSEQPMDQEMSTNDKDLSV